MLDEALVVELLQRCEPRDHPELVRCERRSVRDGVLHRVVHGLVHGPRHEERTDGHIPARQRLGDRHEIRLEAPVLECEELAGAPEARLDLVDAEERAVAAAERLRALEISVGRQVDALPLHRLDEEDRDVLAAKLRARARRGRRTEPGRSREATGRSASVNSGLPFADSEPSVRPWKPWSAEMTRLRFVAARPSFSTASIASVPELVNCTRSSRSGTRASNASASRPGSAVAPS